MSELIYGVIEAGQGSLDALALTLGAATEGIAKLMLQPLAPASDTVSNEVKDLKAFVGSWDGFKPDPNDTKLTKAPDALESCTRTPRHVIAAKNKRSVKRA